MIATSLSLQDEHTAWKQRVNKEHGAAHSFADAFARTCQMNSTVSSMGSMASSPVRMHDRYNMGPRELKQAGVMMIDSSYVNASDPNSMRNFGATRNAVYPLPNPEENSLYTSMYSQKDATNSQFWDSRVRPKSSRATFDKNKTRYTFGGYTPIKQRNGEDEVKTIYKEPLVKTSDYTKNVSQYIFSPNLKGVDMTKTGFRLEEQRKAKITKRDDEYMLRSFQPSSPFPKSLKHMTMTTDFGDIGNIPLTKRSNGYEKRRPVTASHKSSVSRVSIASMDSRIAEERKKLRMVESELKTVRNQLTNTYQKATERARY